MADYARMVVRCTQSTNSDYSDPNFDTRSRDMAATPDYVKSGDWKIDAGSSPMTIVAAGELTSIDFAYIENTGSADIGVNFTIPVLGQTVLIVAAGEILVVPASSIDASAAFIITASSDSEARLFICGS